MHHLINTAILLLFAAFSAAAQNQPTPKPNVSAETLALYAPGEFKGVQYRLMKPIDFDPQKTYPLILSLHGGSGRGTQNIKNLLIWNEYLADEDLRRKRPSFVLAPQSNGRWLDNTSEIKLYPEPGSITIDDLPESMRKFGPRIIERIEEAARGPDPAYGVLDEVLELIDTKLSKQYKIDADRIYVLGHSMGGMGTFTAVYQRPNRFAAAIPSAGFFFPWLDAKRIQDVPLWIFHGKPDKVVDYMGSRHVFDRLNKLNANAKFTTLKGVGHGSKNSPAFKYTGDNPEKGYLTEYASDRCDKTDHVWDWLFRQKRSRPAIVASASDAPSAKKRELVSKWKTVGFRQANSMGAGEAAIPKKGKFRVFVLMGQSNMNGSGRASELKRPYTEKHERIRIWANGRWEYLVPSNRFGPGVSFAHQLADFWPDDTIGIIKVSCGATGISAFEKNWSFERAERSKDGKKGSLYKDLMNAVAEAKRISQPEFCGFVWKQASADGKNALAEEYYDNFKKLISDLGADLGVSNLPTFVPSYAKDKELLKMVLSLLKKEEALEARKSAGTGSVKAANLLETALSHIDASGVLKNAKPAVKKQRHLATVISAQNRAGRELANVVTLYPGKLPMGDDRVHYSSEGYIRLGKITASAVEESYRTKASQTEGSSIRIENK